MTFGAYHLIEYELAKSDDLICSCLGSKNISVLVKGKEAISLLTKGEF